MLDQFIQLKVIKSNPNLQKRFSSKLDNAKFSLQFAKNTPSPYNEENQQLIPRRPKGSKANLQNQKNLIHLNEQALNIKESPMYIGSQYFATQQKVFGQENYFVQNLKACQKVSLIRSPKKQEFSSRQRQKMNNKSPLISSSRNTFIRENSFQKISLHKISSTPSSPFVNSIGRNKPLLVSMQQNIPFNSKHWSSKCEESANKRLILKSLSHQNLSPLKQKLYKITNQTNFQNKITTYQNQFSMKKNKLQRSDSFKRVIERSRQMKKIQLAHKQNEKNSINREYYVFGDPKKPIVQSPQKSNNQLIDNQKLIKNPIKAPLITQKQLSKQDLQTVVPSINKINSFIDETVNNSNMFSFNGQNSSCLNMEPY